MCRFLEVELKIKNLCTFYRLFYNNFPLQINILILTLHFIPFVKNVPICLINLRSNKRLNIVTDHPDYIYRIQG